MKFVATFLLTALLSVARCDAPAKADAYVEGVIVTLLPYGLIVDAQVLENGSKDTAKQRTFLFNIPKKKAYAVGDAILAETIRSGVWHAPNGGETIPAFKVLQITAKRK
jgi:hypothetical protein